MPVHFVNPDMLVWLWLVPALAGTFYFAAIKRRQACRAFSAGVASISRKREAVGSCAAVALAVLALARPAWNLEENQLRESGRDVIFLLDVSRSMLAEDLYPNRLENAKTAILDCVESLSGDRIGLVLFAGSAEVRCPLTIDYDYFRMALRQASPISLGTGGTMIAHAIEKTCDKLIDPERSGLQDVILITDGEDLEEGADEVVAAKLLAEADVRLIAIGIGNRSHGSRIALEDEATGARTFMKHGKSEVWTRLHSETLRKMSSVVPEGVYFEVADGPFNLKHIYWQMMEHVQRASTAQQTVERYTEKFPLFLGGSVLALLLSCRWRGGRARLLAGLLLLAGTVHADPARLFHAGNRAYATGEFADAVDTFQHALSEDPQSAEIFYNLGNAQYRTGNFADAGASFENAAALAGTDDLRSQCYYNLANCMVKTAEGMRESEPQEAIEFCRQATLFYRSALEYRTDFPEAVYNMEISQRIAAAIVKETRDKENKQKQENEQIKYIREKLQEFIDRQTKLIETAQLGEPQRVLEAEVRELAKTIADSGLHVDIVLPDDTTLPGPLKDTYGHTLKAADAMAVPDQSTALAELVAALGSAPENPDKKDGKSDQESEDSDESDVDYQPSDAEAGMYDESTPFGDFSEYEEIRGVPLPNKTEMDILAEEQRNQERRKGGKAGAYKAVEKDW